MEKKGRKTEGAGGQGERWPEGSGRNEGNQRNLDEGRDYDGLQGSLWTCTDSEGICRSYKSLFFFLDKTHGFED